MQILRFRLATPKSDTVQSKSEKGLGRSPDPFAELKIFTVILKRRNGESAARHYPHCGGFCGSSKCRILSSKDLHCHLPHEPLKLSTLFVNGLESTPADS